MMPTYGGARSTLVVPGRIPLSELQLAIMRRLAEGERPKQIFPERSKRTVSEHCRRVRIKLGARTTLQAAVMLVRAGVL